MVKIRLTRYGRKNAPSYRIVAIDSHVNRDGKYLEKLGYYNPTEDSKKVVLDDKRYEYWMSVGAQPTESVRKLVKGTYVYKKYDPHAKKEEAKA